MKNLLFGGGLTIFVMILFIFGYNKVLGGPPLTIPAIGTIGIPPVDRTPIQIAELALSKCPPCNCPDVDAKLKEENDHMKVMIKYLIIVLRIRDAEQEVYKMTHGFSRTFNSPKLEQLRKQMAFFKNKIKGDPGLFRYFEENMNLVI